MSMFSKFNKGVNFSEVNKEVDELEKSNGNFEEVPEGRYEMRIDSAELTVSKSKGLPQVVFQFTILEGEYKKRKLWAYFGVYGEHIAVQLSVLRRFIKDLDCGVTLGSFNDYDELAELIADVEKACDGEEYLIEKGSKNGFTTWKVVEHYAGDDGLI